MYSFNKAMKSLNQLKIYTYTTILYSVCSYINYSNYNQ